MKFSVYRKKKNSYKDANLQDYKKASKRFKWKDAEKQIHWFKGKKLNTAYNAVDKHLTTWRKNKLALRWISKEGNEKKYTFEDLSKLSNKFANLLKRHRVKKGDRVFIFLPRVPELYISFLGIVKTGAIAGVLFAAFGHNALLDRLKDSGACIVITDSELKRRLDQVKSKLPDLKKVIMIDRPRTKGNLLSFSEEMSKSSDKYAARPMGKEEPAFMLYTSGTTGKPKGVIHRHYSCLMEHMTARWVLDLKDDDTYWCTADPGWVTGIAYGILGIWSLGATSIVYGGRFNVDEWYSIIDKYKVNVWYTAPTAVRLFMKAGRKALKNHSIKSLRHICCVGEPLNPEIVKWSIKNLGIPFHDTYWQTETGGIVMANYPCMDIKLGSMGEPVPGIKASIVNDKGKELPPLSEGHLALKAGWPSMMKKIWKNKKKYKSYFIGSWYITGDRAFKDKDGYFWFIGRADDVIKTSGERVGPFEVESALIEHPAIIEAGVIGKPDPAGIRGEIIKAFVVLAKGYKPSDKLRDDLKKFTKKRLAGHAYPREIDFVDDLPKTRSGKIMRRFLKSKELGLPIGDTSTLEKM